MPDIVTRGEWGARSPTSVKDIATPTPELWLHHTVSASGGASRIRAIQDFHMDSRGWSDIAYSYLINASGAIYEGRGLGRAGAHTKGHNSISHGIALLGNFNDGPPSDAALDSLVRLIGWGHELGAWPAHLTTKEHGHGSAWPRKLTGGHRDTRGGGTFDCPGYYLYKLIPTINERTSMALNELEKSIVDLAFKLGAQGDPNYWYSLDADDPEFINIRNVIRSAQLPAQRSAAEVRKIIQDAIANG